MRPHEALNMRTPASVWNPSLRRYNRVAATLGVPDRSLGAEGWQRRKDKSERSQLENQTALAGEWVQSVAWKNRIMIFYGATMVRELDLATQRSTIVERWVAAQTSTPHCSDCKGCPGTLCKTCPGT